MAKQSINIQDGYLFQSLKAGKPMKVELITGRQIEGPLRRFDRFALVLESEGSEVLVYKHAIATVESAAVEE